MMKRRGRITKPLMVFSIGLLASYAVGYGSWVYYIGNTSKEKLRPSTTSEKKICYIKNEKGTTYFTSLDKALSVAYGNSIADSIYVIPNLKEEVKITVNATINKNDTLCLPFDGEIWDGRQILSTTLFDNDDGFADRDKSSVAKNMKTDVVLNNDVVLTNFGTIEIGGILGREGPGVSGCTSGSYCQISMSSDSKIDNYGTIKALGYIKETSNDVAEQNVSELVNNDGAVIYEPFVVYNFNGGSNTYGLYKNNITPFSVYDMPNIRCKIENLYGSSLYGYCDLYAGDQHNTTTALIIAPGNALVNMTTSNSKVVAKYTPDDYRYTVGNVDNASVTNPVGGKTKLSLFGGADFGSLQLYVSVDIKLFKMNVNIDTSKYYFPISWKYDIDLNDGAYTIGNSLKFMLGSSLSIEKDAMLQLSSNLFFFQYSSSDIVDSTYYYPTVPQSAKCIIKGSFVGVSGSLGGVFVNDQDDASILALSNQISLSASVTEGNNNGMSPSTKTYTLNATGPLADDASFSNLSKSYYEWNSNKWMSADKYALVYYLQGYVNHNSEKMIAVTGKNYNDVVTIVTDKPGVKTNVIEFNAWYSSSNLSGNAINPGDNVAINSITSTDNHIALLYPKWSTVSPAKTITIIRSISKDEEHVSGNSETANSTYGSKYKITSPSGWKFDKSSSWKDQWEYVVDYWRNIENNVTFSEEKPTVTVDIDTFQSLNKTLTLNFEMTAKKNCILPTSLILMADGTYKRAGLIRTGDMVMSFNHETGKLEPNVVIGNDDIDKDEQVYNVIHLEFDDGNQTDFIYEHGYFDLTLNKYVYLHEDDFKDYIGHEFVSFNANCKLYNRSKLIRVEIRPTLTKLCSPATANHFNIIADNLLSMPGGLAGLFNIFEYDKNTLAFDKELMQQDIDKYGLLTYEDFKEYFPEEIYNLLPCKYLGVSIGKGLITWKIFENYVAKWKDQLMENVHRK